MISAFIGDIIEVAFCFVTMGTLMSRSSLVYGPLSVVWGLGGVIFTVFFYKHRYRPAWLILLAGIVLGGVYEYICSLFTEIVFGTVFWDYSGFMLNVSGRINILYCSFWGIAALCYIRFLYPVLSRLIEMQKKRPAIILTWICLAAVILDIFISAMALMRFRDRQKGLPASSVADEYIDELYDDSFMIEKYPKAKPVDE